MAGQEQYKGPYRVVVRWMGSDRDHVDASGITDYDTARERADRLAVASASRVTIEDEPTGHTVEVVYDRATGESDRQSEQSSGDTTPVG